MVQTAATTRSFASDPNEPPDVNRDFIGVGAGSILSGLIGAFPVDASPPRTAIVSETGGRSQLAILVAAAIVLVLLAFGSSLLRQIPQAALGGVLLFVALRIIRVSQIVSIYRQSFGEFLLVICTAAAIIILPIEQGVGIGIALSLLHGIWSTTRARLTVFERVPGTSIWWPPSPHIPGESEPGVIVAGFQAPLSFLNAYHFRRDMMALLQTSPKPARLIVLEATGIVEIDFTAAQILNDVIGSLPLGRRRLCHRAAGIGSGRAGPRTLRHQATARHGSSVSQRGGSHSSATRQTAGSGIEAASRRTIIHRTGSASPPKPGFAGFGDLFPPALRRAECFPRCFAPAANSPDAAMWRPRL